MVFGYGLVFVVYGGICLVLIFGCLFVIVFFCSVVYGCAPNWIVCFCLTVQDFGFGVT